MPKRTSSSAGFAQQPICDPDNINASDLGEYQSDVPNPTSPSQLYIPGAFPRQIPRDRNDHLVDTSPTLTGGHPISTFTTVRRWAWRLSKALFVKLPVYLHQTFRHQWRIRPVPVCRSDGSRKRRLICDGIQGNYVSSDETEASLFAPGSPAWNTINVAPSTPQVPSAASHVSVTPSVAPASGFSVPDDSSMDTSDSEDSFLARSDSVLSFNTESPNFLTSTPVQRSAYEPVTPQTPSVLPPSSFQPKQAKHIKSFPKILSGARADRCKPPDLFSPSVATPNDTSENNKKRKSQVSPSFTNKKDAGDQTSHNKKRKLQPSQSTSEGVFQQDLRSDSPRDKNQIQSLLGSFLETVGLSNNTSHNERDPASSIDQHRPSNDTVDPHPKENMASVAPTVANTGPGNSVQKTLYRNILRKHNLVASPPIPVRNHTQFPSSFNKLSQDHVDSPSWIKYTSDRIRLKNAGADIAQRAREANEKYKNMIMCESDDGIDPEHAAEPEANADADIGGTSFEYENDLSMLPDAPDAPTYSNDLSELPDAPTPSPRKTVRFTEHHRTKSFFVDGRVSDMLDSIIEGINASPQCNSTQYQPTLNDHLTSQAKATSQEQYTSQEPSSSKVQQSTSLKQSTSQGPSSSRVQQSTSLKQSTSQGPSSSRVQQSTSLKQSTSQEPSSSRVQQSTSLKQSTSQEPSTYRVQSMSQKQQSTSQEPSSSRVQSTSQKQQSTSQEPSSSRVHSTSQKQQSTSQEPSSSRVHSTSQKQQSTSQEPSSSRVQSTSQKQSTSQEPSSSRVQSTSQKQSTSQEPSSSKKKSTSQDQPTSKAQSTSHKPSTSEAQRTSQLKPTSKAQPSSNEQPDSDDSELNEASDDFDVDGPAGVDDPSETDDSNNLNEPEEPSSVHSISDTHALAGSDEASSDENDTSGFLGVPRDIWSSSDNEESINETALSGELFEDLSTLALANDAQAASTATAPVPTSQPAPSAPVTDQAQLLPLVSPLTDDEYQQLQSAAQKTGAGKKRDARVTSRLTAHDFSTLLPSLFDGNASAWLNDEVINEYLAILVKYQKDREGHDPKNKNGPAPSVHAFSSAWYASASKNLKNVGRWASRAVLGGEKLLDAELLLFPVCDSSHWRLIAVKPQERSIEYLDSLGWPGHSYMELLGKYLAQELGAAYVASEWTAKEAQRSVKQSNASDCGIFAILNALTLLRGDEPSRVVASDGMQQARLRVAATLLAGKPTTEFH